MQNTSPWFLFCVAMAISPTSFVNQNFADSLADDKGKENPPQPRPQVDAFPSDTEPRTGEEDATVDDEGAAASAPAIVVDLARESGNRTAEEEAGHYTTFSDEESDEQWGTQPAVLSDEPTGKLSPRGRGVSMGGAILALFVRRIGGVGGASGCVMHYSLFKCINDIGSSSYFPSIMK